MMFTDELRDELESAIARHGRRRRRRTVAVGSLAVLVGVAVLGWWQWGPSETETTDVATSAQERAEAQSERPTSTPEPTVGAEPPVSPLEVPEAPPAEPEAGIDLDLVGTVTVWMGDELFVWGGTEAFGSGTTTASLGATYDPSADSWTPLPPAPGGPQAEAVGVWTGSEVLLCCGTNSGNALGFDPESRRWRELPEPPLADRRPGPGSSWVGGRFVVVGATEMVAYSPVTDTWEVLQPPPVELTVSPAASIVAVGDNELVVWPRQFARRVTSGYVYNLETNTWAQLPDPPQDAWPAIAGLAWTGEELVTVGGLPAPMGGDSQRMVGSRLDWDSMTWRALPDVWPEPVPSEGNLGSQSVLWTGDVVLVLAGALGSGLDPLDTIVATYNPQTEVWRRLANIPRLSYQPPLVLTGERTVLVNIGGSLQALEIQAEVGAVGDEAWSAVPRTDFDDLPVRNVALTLVGSNGNGADVVVLDLDLGIETIYLDDEHHTAGSGGLTDMVMSPDRFLYIWRGDQPTLRFDAGPAPWDGRGSRLSFGELAQPPTVIGAPGPERRVVPVAPGGWLWVWEAVGSTRKALLVDAATGEAVLARSFDDGAPVDATTTGTLVISDDNKVASITTNGLVSELGEGRALLVAGQEVLVQSCDDQVCRRWWVDAETGASRPAGEDASIWSSVGGPVIPGSAAPLRAASPGNEQVLVGVAPIGEPFQRELWRVDVHSGEAAVVSLADGVSPSLATWSRDGRHVVAVDTDGGVAVADLRSGTTRTFDLIPEGFFVLAAG